MDFFRFSPCYETPKKRDKTIKGGIQEKEKEKRKGSK
jgi:hypothetical protein